MPKDDWCQFEWDDENQKNGNVQHLRDHGIEPEEAEECFSTTITFAATSVGSMMSTFLDGSTDRGRWLRLVFQDKGDGLARIFTGWDLKPKKRKKKP